MKKKIILKRFLWSVSIIFLLMNVVAFFHAYKFTHFSKDNVTKTKDAKHLSTADKIKILFCGIDNPRPVNKEVPSQKFETINLSSNKNIECWSIKVDRSIG